MQGIGNRTLDRLVVLRKWPIREGREWREDAADAFRIHDKGTHVIRRLRIPFEIRYIVAYPLLLRFVPPNLSPLGIPGLAGGITRRAVVHHTPICRPGPRPVLINAEAGWIIRAASLHLRAGLSP